MQAIKKKNAIETSLTDTEFKKFQQITTSALVYISDQDAATKVK